MKSVPADSSCLVPVLSCPCISVWLLIQSVLLNRGSVGMLKGLLQKAPLNRRAINRTWGGWHFAVILVRFVVVVGEGEEQDLMLEEMRMMTLLGWTDSD